VTLVCETVPFEFKRPGYDTEIKEAEFGCSADLNRFVQLYLDENKLPEIFTYWTSSLKNDLRYSYLIMVSCLLQYCAKVMRANFDEFRALFSSKYRRTFNRYFAAFVRQLNEISTTLRQGKRKIKSKNRKANRKVAFWNFQTTNCII